MTIISTQADWNAIRGRFHRSSDYRIFVKECSFDPTSIIRLTGKSIDDVLPRAKKGGARRNIFEQAMLDGRTVEEVNRCAREVALKSSKPTWDADIFIALFREYAVFEGRRR